MTQTTSPEVLVVGFGPVGAVLAGLLGRRGIRVMVIDREAGIYPLPRAAHIDSTGLRTLQELGCVDRMLPTMLPNLGTECVTADRHLLFRLPSVRPSTSGLPTSVYFHQPTFDSELRRTVAAFDSVEVRLETELVGLEQDAEGVALDVIGPAGRTRIRANWVVGCDGAASQVRKAVGITTESFGFEEQWLIFDLRLSDPPPQLPPMAVQVCDPHRPHTELPMPGGRYRFEFMLMPREEPEEMLRPDVAEALLLSPLVPLGSVTIERTATYQFQGVVADRWRSGRVLVAGDAAHLMPPFLGQGMCSGIRDAANLAWKLATVLRGSAPLALLDTYGEERRPHVAEIIKVAVDFGRIICMTDPVEADRRDRALLADPRSPDSRFNFSLPRLLPGRLILDGGGSLLPQPVGLPGERLDDWVGNRFLVLGANDEALDETVDWWRDTLGACVIRVDELREADRPIAEWFRRLRTGVVVVRPDRYVLGIANRLGQVTSQVRCWLDEGSSS